jgi:hypothetical protein
MKSPLALFTFLSITLVITCLSNLPLELKTYYPNNEIKKLKFTDENLIVKTEDGHAHIFNYDPEEEDFHLKQLKLQVNWVQGMVTGFQVEIKHDNKPLREKLGIFYFEYKYRYHFYLLALELKDTLNAEEFVLESITSEEKSYDILFDRLERKINKLYTKKIYFKNLVNINYSGCLKKGVKIENFDSEEIWTAVLNSEKENKMCTITWEFEDRTIETTNRISVALVACVAKINEVYGNKVNIFLI